jgi:hypothetical protein
VVSHIAQKKDGGIPVEDSIVKSKTLLHANCASSRIKGAMLKCLKKVLSLVPRGTPSILLYTQ